MAKSNFYVVWVGVKPGIYTTWTETSRNVSGFKGAKFKGFPNEESAEEALKQRWDKYISLAKSTEPIAQEENVLCHQEIITEVVDMVETTDMMDYLQAPWD